jgi:hypothetical protein
MAVRNTDEVLKSVARSLTRRAFSRRRIAVRELRNKILFGSSALALRRFEDAEVRRLSDQITLPSAQVAVIMATYRRPALLLWAVRSVLAQTVDDLTILVVDDGGGLPKLPEDPRLQACSLSVNTGVAGIVRNVGIRLTRSTYVAFLDDDNEWEPNHLEVAIAAFEEAAPLGRTPGIVYTAVRRILPDGRLLDILSTPFDRRLLAREGFVDTNSLVIRRFPELHFSRISRKRGIRPLEDWELVYRLSRHVPTIHVLAPTVRYRVNPESYYTDWSNALEKANSTDTATNIGN